MKAERAPAEYNPGDQDRFRDDVEREFGRTLKTDEDVEITPDQRAIWTDKANNQRYRVELSSASGTRQFVFTPI